MRAALLCVLALACACRSTGGGEVREEPPTPAPPLTLALPGGPTADEASEPPAVVEPPVAETETPAVQGEATDASLDGAEDPPGTPLGWVAGDPITAEQLVLEWHDFASQDLFLVLEKVVTTRLAVAEAQRLGLRIEPELAETAFARERQRVQDEYAAEGRPLSFEDHVRVDLGIRPEAYYARLRIATIRQMIAERVVRTWTLESDWARVRIIAVRTEEEMQAIQTELGGGADFAALASERSMHASAAKGGVIPFLVKQDGSLLSVAAFASGVGEVTGPYEISGARVLMRVEQLSQAKSGGWAVLGREVETSLAAHPIEDTEFLSWKLTMEQRYPIDVSPLKQLLGVDG